MMRTTTNNNSGTRAETRNSPFLFCQLGFRPQKPKPSVKATVNAEKKNSRALTRARGLFRDARGPSRELFLTLYS